MKIERMRFPPNCWRRPGPPRGSDTRATRWRRIARRASLLWLLAWYCDTVWSIVAIWERSDTFAHGFLIVPISAWLIWQRRHVLAALELRPNFLALPLLAAGRIRLVLRRTGGGRGRAAVTPGR